jgi:nucleoside phosphorylase
LSDLDDGGPLLIVAAWAPELRGLGRVFSQGKSKAAPPSGRTATGALPAVRVTGSAPVRAVVGVGLVEAAAGTARLIERQRPRAIVLVGTAGLYPGADKKLGLAIGGAVIGRSFLLASDAVAREAAYLPGPLPASAASTPALLEAVTAATALPVADVACPVGITLAPALAQQRRKGTNAALENLEAFAVARAAAAAGVPFVAVLGIANLVGPDAHAEWRAHAATAAAAACTAVRRWLAET